MGTDGDFRAHLLESQVRVYLEILLRGLISHSGALVSRVDTTLEYLLICKHHHHHRRRRRRAPFSCTIKISSEAI